MMRPVATVGEWAAGARPRTLPAAVTPVVIGTGAAAAAGGPVWWKAALALVVALALQVGVNYANDYSDGVRGTDTRRVGPMRLVGSGAASPRAVRAAAVACFAAAAISGLVLAVLTAWWLVLVGAAAIAAAWTYTGGSRPYGYRGFGELAVFIFFGLVAVLGTTYVQVGRLTGPAYAGAVAAGALTCAILVANNLRDAPTDAAVGKRTLVVVLGDQTARRLYAGLVAGGFASGLLAAPAHPGLLAGLLAVPLGVRPVRRVLGGASGPALIPVLGDTGRAELAFGVLLALGLALS